MTDPRHPRSYPRGGTIPVTPDWKRRVKDALEQNAREGREPSNEAELARAVGADKGGLGRMLRSAQGSYRYGRAICEILGLDEAMVPNPSIRIDEWEDAVAEIRALPPDKQRQALLMLRAFLKSLDG